MEMVNLWAYAQPHKIKLSIGKIKWRDILPNDRDDPIFGESVLVDWFLPFHFYPYRDVDVTTLTKI